MQVKLKHINTHKTAYASEIKKKIIFCAVMNRNIYLFTIRSQREALKQSYLDNNHLLRVAPQGCRGVFH